MAVGTLSWAAPTAKELEETRLLREYLTEQGLYESAAEAVQREEVLGKLDALVKDWVRTVAMAEGYDADAVEQANGKIFTFGSYRLGVHGPGADIDTLCVGPAFCTREGHFFGWQPLCLEQILREHPEVQDVQAVQDAFVPVIKMKFGGIEIDLLYAQLQLSNVPHDLDVRAVSTIRNCYGDSVRALNGCRVTDTILAEVSDAQKDDFKLALKALKLWGERKGVYSNVAGYLGGVNWAILVAYVCKLYPRATACVLMAYFFRIFHTRKWPTPVLLRDITTTAELDMGLPQWDPRRNRRDQEHIMPIITPCYPEQNSSYNVSASTFEVMRAEFRASCAELEDALFHRPRVDWGAIFAEDNFFDKFKNYLQVEVVAGSEETFRPWQGWVNSRLRQLTMKLEPLVMVRPWPVPVKPPPDERWSGPRAHYYLGIRKKAVTSTATTLSRAAAKNVNLNTQVSLAVIAAEFLARARSATTPLTKEFRSLVQAWDQWSQDAGMDVIVRSLKQSDLPLECFPGGRRPSAAGAAAAAAAEEHNATAELTETAEQQQEGLKRKREEDRAAEAVGIDPKKLKPGLDSNGMPQADSAASGGSVGPAAAAAAAHQQLSSGSSKAAEGRRADQGCAHAEASLSSTGEVGEYVMPAGQPIRPAPLQQLANGHSRQDAPP